MFKQMCKSLWIGLFFCFNNHFVSASNVQVEGYLESHSPSYYTGVDGHFLIRYTSDNQHPDTRVFLHFGFEKSEFFRGELKPVDSWLNISDVEMNREQSGEFSTEIVKRLYERGSSIQLTALQFVFRVQRPDGASYYDKGNLSPLGFYQVARPAGFNLEHLNVVDIKR